MNSESEKDGMGENGEEEVDGREAGKKDGSHSCAAPAFARFVGDIQASVGRGREAAHA